MDYSVGGEEKPRVADFAAWHLREHVNVAVGDGADEISEEELMKRAEAFAIRRNGRSPRTARQFIELLKIGL